MLHGTQFINPSSSLSQSRPAGATTRLNGVSDNHIHSIRESYDRLADEYARRMFKEFQHKPLDRLLVLRLTSQDVGKYVTWAAGLVVSLATCVRQARQFSAWVFPLEFWNRLDNSNVIR